MVVMIRLQVKTSVDGALFIIKNNENIV